MANQRIGVTDQPAGGGIVEVDATEISDGTNLVQRQRIILADDATFAALAKVLNAAPGTSDYGLATRPIGGAAGTPAGSVLSVQGVASGTTLPVTATAPTITKGTQGATGFSTQDLKDAGRNPTHYYSNAAVAGASAEALLSLTGTKSGVGVTATTTPAVVTAGKTLRITRFAATFVATATSVYAVFKLRYNTATLVAITSPVLAVIVVGAGTPATANSSNTAQADIPDGLEIPAGAGIGISCQTFNGTTATNGGLVAASVLGFEY